MLYDVSKVLKNFGETIDVSGSLELPNLKKANGAAQFMSLSFSGTIENIGGVLLFSAKANGRYLVLCSKCAKELEKDFSCDISELLVNEEIAGERENDDAVTFSGHEADLDSVVLANVYLLLPSVFLCKEDCKGLCKKCGADLNLEKCTCSDDDIDPRWEALKNFVICDSE